MPHTTFSSLQSVFSSGKDKKNNHGVDENDPWSSDKFTELGDFHPEECRTPICRDSDQDGYYAQSSCGTSIDCNDSDPDISPNHAEICDDKDNQCPGNTGYGIIDEGCGNLVNIVVNSNNISINIWDCGNLEDGDQIDLLVNGSYIRENFILSFTKEIINITLNDGANTLSVHADNEGTNPPNTACLEISNVTNGEALQNWALYQGTDNSMYITVQH